MEEDNHLNTLEVLRCRLSYWLASALYELYPQVKLGLMQLTPDGFHLDFDLGQNNLSANDFDKLKIKLEDVIPVNSSIKQRDSLDLPNAISWAKNNQQDYLLEYFQSKAKNKTSLEDTQAPFSFLLFILLSCTNIGGDLGTGHLPVFKIMKIGGAYWQGDQSRPQLQRIWVVVFNRAEDLKDYLDKKQDSLIFDHRQIGKDQNLFMFSDLVGAGLPLWLENGAIIRRQLENFIVEEEIKRGYIHVYTPDIARLSLYEESGHYPYYRDSMYAPIDIEGKKFMLRPMTCPHHFQIYKQRPHSFRELPVRLAELAKLYRHEKSGELGGLMRIRSFTLADAHIICQPDQVEAELEAVLELIEDMAAIFGLVKDKDYSYRLSLGERGNSSKYFQDDQAWKKAEESLRQVLNKRADKFITAPDEAAFYGPKIDVQMINQAGKEETAFTVQYDFVMPERFNLTFVDKMNRLRRAVVIHRSSIGAIERLMAFLIEFYKGKFPVWLSPCQLKILTVNDSDDLIDLAQKLKQKALDQQIRVQIDITPHSIGKKIRQSQLESTPYVLVLGPQELATDIFNLRIRPDLSTVSDLKADQTYSFEEIIKALKSDIQQKH